ncbi:MAG: outer membrane protein assembly factor BamD [Verrucomicrobiota bacterium]
MKQSKYSSSAAKAAVALAIILAALAVDFSALGAEIRGTIVRKNGNTETGDISWLGASKTYRVRKDGVSIRVAPDEVAEVRVPKPEGFDRAVQQIQRGSYSAGIDKLESVRDDYERLGWDIQAARWLAYAYLNDNNSSKALRMCEDVIDNNPQAALDPAFASVYWDALIEQERIPALKDKLEKAIREGSRELAAVAQIKRGHMERKNANFEKALVDGYLRTIVMFKRVRSAQPEALYYAIRCFEELGQHTHAEEMRKTLLEQFPDNSYTRKLRSEM